ncbi:hypothetical protein WG904_02845 [Pedobacter sp. Du54]|uniref:hypothetical protein n=1 Tax=Pedobacter anseongensis TaxID=3133439 RepID=UPI003098631A
MRFTCENNHVRNLANFDTLIAKISEFSKGYNPAKSSIQLGSLSIVSQNTKVAIAYVNQLTHQYIHSTNSCDVIFETLQFLNLKIHKVLQSAININETELYMLLETQKVMGKPFALQEHYDSMLKNFSKVIKLLKENPFYLPQKSELKIPKLEDFYTSLYQKTNEVKQNYALLKNAQLILNEVLYREHNGLVTLATLAKMYIKYHYGWDSDHYKQVARLIIKKAK